MPIDTSLFLHQNDPVNLLDLIVKKAFEQVRAI